MVAGSVTYGDRLYYMRLLTRLYSMHEASRTSSGEGVGVILGK